MKEKVKFIGPVYDREKLLEYYNRAKIFCLTSRTECFANVFSESSYFGDYIITTNVGGAEEITEIGKYGEVVEQEDLEGYITCLQNTIDGTINLQEKYDEIIERRENITWKNLIEQNKEFKRIFTN